MNNKPLYLPGGGILKLPLTLHKILLLISAVSFGITGLDVFIAHLENHFHPVYEWIPVIYLPLAAVLTIVYFLQQRNPWIKIGYQSTMGAGIVIGIVGTLFHLLGNVNPNSQNAIEWFASGIPVLAPIAITGLALYGLALAAPESKLLIRLIGLAFLVTGLTALLDHAPTHFENLYTLIPVVGGIMSFSVLWLFSLYANQPSKQLELLPLIYSLMILMILVGIVGFYVHIKADLSGTTAFSWARIFYRAPTLAPLGFSQLGFLGLLSLCKDSK